MSAGDKNSSPATRLTRSLTNSREREYYTKRRLDEAFREKKAEREQKRRRDKKVEHGLLQDKVTYLEEHVQRLKVEIRNQNEVIFQLQEMINCEVDDGENNDSEDDNDGSPHPRLKFPPHN